MNVESLLRSQVLICKKRTDNRRYLPYLRPNTNIDQWTAARRKNELQSARGVGCPARACPVGRSERRADIYGALTLPWSVGTPLRLWGQKPNGRRVELCP